ncbi:hypothetical protein [Virgibacillus salexigens]|uniref:hypothetical protein n=1 Tax=Virgibacillus TaxID=84406 RepID=UPI0013706C61|nr:MULTISPECIES: hypothetical protein [Virgibacillus]MYL40691.1 hypothetical protein [Virgibacillus massiliensis]
MDKHTSDTFRKRIENFSYHYKYHTIAAICLLLLVSSLGYTLIEGQIAKSNDANKAPADLDIMLFGNYQEEDFSSIEQRVQKSFPNWERIHIRLVYVPNQVNATEDMANFQQGQIAIKENKPDIYIFDLGYFKRFVEDGPFLSLEQLALPSSVTLLFHQKESDTKEHPYGLDLSDHPLFSGLAIASASKIAVIREDGDNRSHAEALFKELYKETY